MNNVKLSFIGLIGCLLFACKPKPDLSLEDWNCKTIDDEQICVPTSWVFKPQSKSLFFSYLDNRDKNSYFAVLKYNKTTSGLTVSKYLKELYTVLQQKDTLELSQGYTLQKLTSNNAVTYHNEIYTSIANIQYVTYSTLFERGNDLFEICLKIDVDHSTRYQQLYRDILFKFRYKDSPIFTPEERINKIDTIDLSNLK